MSRKRKTIKPLEVRTRDKKIEEVKEALKEKMLDPKNISPTSMPGFAPLDSYSGFMGSSGPEIEDNGDTVEMEPDIQTPSENHTQTPSLDPVALKTETPTTSPKIVESGESYVMVEASQPKQKLRNIDSIKAYNRVKDQLKASEEKASALEEELEDVKTQLNLAIRDRGELEKKVSTLEESARLSAGKVDRKKYEDLLRENEDLLLRNSELELEVSMARATKVKEDCRKASPQPTYSPQGYSNIPRFNDTRPSMNGYQDWI